MKTTNQKLNLILSFGVLVFISCDYDRNADSPGGPDGATTGNVQESRKQDFVNDVIESSTKEIAWLKAGISKGTDNELKSNAQKMLSDHETLKKDLTAYAESKNIPITNDIDTSNVVDINDKPGIEWDEEWADEVGDNHVGLVNRFERANRNISDDDTALKNIIAKALPVLQSHADASRKLEAKLEGNN